MGILEDAEIRLNDYVCQNIIELSHAILENVQESLELAKKARNRGIRY